MIGKTEFEALLAEPLRTDVVVVNGKEFRIQEMTEEQGAEYELALQTNGKTDMKKARRAMLALMLVDADGNRLVESGDQLLKLSLGYANPIWDKCLDLNRYAEKDIEALVKNSEGVEGSV